MVMDRSIICFDDSFAFEIVNFSLGMDLPELVDMVLFPEIQLVNCMGHVQVRSNALKFGLHVVIEIGVATDMEVARHLLHSERSNQSAPIFLLECLLHLLQLLMWILLMQ